MTRRRNYLAAVIECGHPIWPRCGRLIWPQLRPIAALRFGLCRARSGGRGRDGIESGTVRADPQGSRSGGLFGARAGAPLGFIAGRSGRRWRRRCRRSGSGRRGGRRRKLDAFQALIDEWVAAAPLRLVAVPTRGGELPWNPRNRRHDMQESRDPSNPVEGGGAAAAATDLRAATRP